MKYVVGLITVAVLVGGTFVLVNRPQRIVIDARPPDDFPPDGFSHAQFESLLERYVDAAGNVDYDAWQASDTSVAELESYLGAVARFSPENAPARFADDSARLAYWMYAYNAYVVRAVLHNWPIGSVTDLKAPLEVVTGLGFFHRQRFAFGGVYRSLLDVENNTIRKRFRDPRIHFVLNCASESCPPMRPTLPTGDALGILLDDATRDFVSDPRNVSIDHANRRIVLSTIFKWFKKDFVNDLAHRGLSSRRGVVDYVASVAPDALRRELDRTEDYDVVFRDYDWSLNATH